MTSLENSEPFCECWKNHLRSPTPWDHLNTCKCGEDYEIREWAWDKISQPSSSSMIFSDDCNEVTFHPFYSSGTALVKGDQALAPGRHYYWEIKMLTRPYGTDIMVGVGTPKTSLPDERRYQFASLLGENAESYGLSYTGAVYHDSKRSSASPGFGRGSIIGVRVDMWAGTLEFFINRKPIGAVFQDLKKHKELFPMMSSTAAKSAMRLIYAASWKASLLVDAAKILAESIRNSANAGRDGDGGNRKYVKLPPGLFATLQRQFWITMPLEDEDINEYVDPAPLPDLSEFSNTMMSLIPGACCNSLYVDSIPPEFRLVLLN